MASGLYRHERYYVRVYLPFSVLLFLAGASLAFCFVFQPVLRFLLNFNGMLGINPTPQISDWLNFVLLVPLCFGISFQLPLVMLFLERIGVFTVNAYLSKWRIAVLAIVAGLGHVGSLARPLEHDALGWAADLSLLRRRFSLQVHAPPSEHLRDAHGRAGIGCGRDS